MDGYLSDIDVLILCGGKGKRIRKICPHLPKPMAKIGSRHFLDIMLGYLAGFGFKRFILAVGYKANVIKGYYRKKKPTGIEICFSEEKKPLDTGGAVKYAAKQIKSKEFFVLNGDSFCEFEPIKFLKFHRGKKACISILLQKVAIGGDYGRVAVDRSSRIVSFDEKNPSARNCFINAGIYLFDRKTFYLMPKRERFSLERDFFPSLAGKRIFGFRNRGFFIDIGTPERYATANKYFSRTVEFQYYST
ncbi:MAG: hypothetical protein A3G33_05325 [Omnitrophica bacterium RIFCSPLOWO2_12_FULL_44_17]|uniref:Nucleotidyl transferase domain-containing protein n=1 Tax=Candidatus Danuiimicrobium aquiferis TaxID=1801832 RepID=A0A1G1KQ29_9BACT|nr:MAG: hypothetical protein A3B72_05030 [Omnitrophica bacterium RIFCSPHIGHO2_02_FULL_45_28]OGW92543.1 MAG: hypothetical protein A3E74_04855 [Omnitrophica bacterium RIFCSPHIGHO2_12_FULL_44_12]OGW95054.1 MAG: hypothetical protein A3G33_05325 [Omnitrophica bacterium RIFCSPLOWO2_12_FULL_44_17]OGX02974.1 MAG: hypothetical protein A3J12_01550 [Omnitrophica bacterium RIFCSPLOWO2_02_FULL_44_11]